MPEFIEKEICCCGGGGWTKAIGWFQAITYGLFVILILLATAFLMVDRGDLQTHEEVTNDIGVLFNLKDLGGRQIVGALSITLIIVVIAFSMSIVLLKGSYERNPVLLNIWRRFTMALIIVNIFPLIILITMAPQGAEGQIIRNVFGIGMNLFFVWVVGVHRQEILKYQAAMALDTLNEKLHGISIDAGVLSV